MLKKNLLYCSCTCKRKNYVKILFGKKIGKIVRGKEQKRASLSNFVKAGYALIKFHS